MPELFLPGNEFQSATAVLDRPEALPDGGLTFEEQALLDILTDQVINNDPYGGGPQALIRDYTGRIVGATPLPRSQEEAPQANTLLQQRNLGEGFLSRLERGFDAADVVQRAASRFLKPLVSALSGDPGLRPRIQNLLYDGTESDPSRPRRFTLAPNKLVAQRPLGPKEREYLSVVQDITEVNPYLVAAGAVEPGIAHAVLRAEFDRRSTRTRAEVKSGSSVPLVVAGAGIHGTIASGSILLERPDLLEDVLFLDRAVTPGGVFERANGDAHRVNSANYVGKEPFVLPRQITDDTIRLDAGIFPQSPGERTDPGKGRTGSINRLVPFFPPPDEYDRSSRYVSNWTFSLAAKLQDSLLMRRFRGETDLRQIDLNRGSGSDEFKVTTQDLQTGEPFEVTTSNVLLPTGLGRARSVIRKDTYFAEITRAQQEAGPERFPIYCDAVEGYNYFADRTRGPVTSGRRFAIVGSGDSAATLVEALAGLYKAGNLGEVDKIVVVAESPLSGRCRYTEIQDALERFQALTGRKNLLELVSNRVERIAMVEDPADAGIGENNPVRLYDQFGAVVRGFDGRLVEVDHVIEATGFESELEEILRPLLRGARLEESVRDITAPSNPFISVGQVLAAYPGIAIVGTAARPKFNGDKRAALPAGTQEVLNAVSENVVAIGLRGADTTIATKQWLRSRQGQLPLYMSPAGETPATPISPSTPMSDTFTVPRSRFLAPTDKKLEANSALLTPLLLLPLNNRGLMEQGTVDMTPANPGMDPNGQTTLFERLPVEGERQYSASVVIEDDKVRVTPDRPMPVELLRELTLATMDPYFQSYGIAAMRARRSGSIAVKLSYKGSQLDLENSIVQAV